MIKIYKLHNQIKHYGWGSPKLLPLFLGIENSKEIPYAELWMGTHCNGPSRAELIFSGTFMEQSDSLRTTGSTASAQAKNPVKTSREGNLINLSEISGDLSFLFKLLAVEKPLSIQAHPDKDQARKGFEQEEKEKLDLKAPRRNYKDPNHKPEILCALTPFTLLAGFRELEEIKKSLEEFSTAIPQLKEIISQLLRSLNTESLAVLFRILFDFSKYEREYLSSMICRTEINETKSVSPAQWKLMKEFAYLYPEDPAILSPLYLNLMTLQPGEAIFIPAGVLHSYISGFAVELMAASDNVLRGGLTPKYVDIPELMNILNFSPFKPQSITATHPSSWFSYDMPCEEFLLAQMHGDGTESIFPVKGNAICIITEGMLYIGSISFKKGESFFIFTDGEPVSFSGNYSLFAAMQK